MAVAASSIAAEVRARSAARSFSIATQRCSSVRSLRTAVESNPSANFAPGAIPAAPDNLFWVMTHLAGELFFVATVAYLVMASLHTVPRWALLVPLAQVAYNLKNSLVWLVLFPYFSPTRTPNLFMLAGEISYYASAYLGT